MPEDGPLKNQKKLMKCIVKLTEKLGRGPHYDEIAEALGVNEEAVYATLRRLEPLGFVEATVARACVTVTKAGAKWL